MSLRLWLPLRGDLNNQGLDKYTCTGTNVTVDNSGKIGKCYSFNGTSSMIKTTENLFLQGDPEFSVCFWVYANAWTNDYAAILEQDNNQVAKTMSITCYSGKMALDIWNYRYQMTTGISAQQWHHVAVTKTPGALNATTKIYIDGVLDTNCSGTADIPNFVQKPLIIGRLNAATNRWFNGKLNDVRIYDHALSAKEVEEISKGLVLHYKLDALNPNMLAADQDLSKWTKESGISVTWDSTVNMYKVTDSTHTSSRWGIYRNIPLKANTTYTFSVMGMKVDQDACLGFGEGTSSYPTTAGTFTTTQSRLQKTITIGANDATARIYLHLKPIADGTNYGYFVAPRLVINSSNDDIVYDVSGYQNNGSVINNIGITYLSPRYESAIVLSNSAVIKILENNWATQGMLEMTINFWAKPTAAFTKFLSCTESGGFNTESGNSGYLRFPVHVYTNAAQSTTAYKYDSNELQISAIPQNEWTMITLIYTTVGTKTYINGELHHTYNNVSYGIHFNMAARLFLGCEAASASPSSPYYTGQMSDFRIYVTALTADQIKELYNTSMAIDSNGNIMAREIQE